MPTFGDQLQVLLRDVEGIDRGQLDSLRLEGNRLSSQASLAGALVDHTGTLEPNALSGPLGFSQLPHEAACAVRNQSFQSINNTTYTRFDFDTEAFDTFQAGTGFLDIPTDDSKVTIPVQGIYFLSCDGTFDSGANNLGRLVITLNHPAGNYDSNYTLLSRGTHSHSASYGANVYFGLVWTFDRSDVLEIWGYHNKGSAANCNAIFGIVRIR